MRQEVRARGTAEGSRERPFWTDVLRALREARGVTQDGWATWLGVSRKTVQRWESGAAVPDPSAEAALVDLCRQRGLFRAYDGGPLCGRTLAPEMLRDLLAEARLSAPPILTAPVAAGVLTARLVARSIDGRAAVYSLRAPETTIGRGVDNDIVNASDLVSRYHARIAWDGRCYLVEDLASKNGTTVGGEPVTAPRPLRHGDVLLLAGRADLALTFDGGGDTVTAGRESLPGGGLWVDSTTAEVWLRGRKLDLSPAEYRALALLYERAGQLVSAVAIADSVWPDGSGPAPEAAVAALIEALRRTLEPTPDTPRYLQSEPGGYRLMIS